MKKLFTLIAAALMAVGVNAEEKVVISTPITIEASAADKWGGSDVFTIAASDVASGDFLKIYIGVAEAGEGEQNVVQFHTKDDASVYYGSDFHPAANDVVTIPVNDAILAVLTGGFKFGGCIQQTSGSWSAVPGKKVVIDKISVVPATDFSVVSLYDEAVATSGAWKAVNMGKANFQIAKAGDIIVANFNADDATRDQGNFQFVLGGYTAGFWVVPPFTVINVTEELVTKMASGGFYYQGGKFPFTVTAKLYRQKDGLPTNETSLEVAATELGKWEKSVSIAKDKFANVAAGDELHVMLTDWKSVKYDGEGWTRTAQLQLKSGAEGNPALECSAEAADAAGVSEVVFILTAADVTTIQENGLVIGGQCATINGVKLITAKAASEGGETSLAINYAEMKAGDFTVENAQVNASESKDTKTVYDITGGQELKFWLNTAPSVVFTITNGGAKAKIFNVNFNDNTTTDKGSVEFGGKNGVVIINDAKVGDEIKMTVAAKGSTAGKIGVLPSSGNDLITSTVLALPKKDKEADGADAEGYVWKEFSFKVTEDMIKTLEGVKVVRIKETDGGYRCKALSINAPLPTGIQNIKAATKTIENNVIYNLAGQKVNESYKGIVIKNGKKYIQK